MLRINWGEKKKEGGRLLVDKTRGERGPIPGKNSLNEAGSTNKALIQGGPQVTRLRTARKDEGGQNVRFTSHK